MEKAFVFGVSVSGENFTDRGKMRQEDHETDS